MIKRLSALFLVVLLLACGKRGDPKPPVPVIPRGTSDLVVTQRGTRLLLSWSYPSLTTSGQALGRNIQRIVVYRTVEELPVPAQGRDPNTILPGDVDPTVPRSVALFSKIPTLAPPQFLKLRTRVDSIEGANLPAATVGSKLTFEDAPAFRTIDGRPVRITYAVVTETVTREGEVSNLATIVPLDVPVPPASVTVAAKPQGVVLEWQKPSAAATGASAQPVLLGYNIYRISAGQPVDELALPVNPAPVTETTYTDVPPYGDFEYRVTAVATAGPPRIESLPSEAVKATFKDLLPPPPPGPVTALVETRQVRLVWEPSEAPDLDGYLIYRTEGTAKLKLSPGPVRATNFSDISVAEGISYFYSITAVDKNRNESAPTNSEMVLVPKTP